MAMRRSTTQASRVWGVLVLLGVAIFFVVMRVPADGGVSVASEEIAGLLIPVVFIGFLVALYARTQIRARRRPATNHAEYVVGDHGEVRQLGAPHAGFFTGDVAPPPMAAPAQAARRPAPQAAARPGQANPTAQQRPPAARRSPRPTHSTTPALHGSCLFSHDWQPSTLQYSSLHRSD